MSLRSDFLRRGLLGDVRDSGFRPGNRGPEDCAINEAMSEGLDLPDLQRETLLPPAERLARLELAQPQILAALEGETDPITIQATLACLLFEACIQTNWCGFYRRVSEGELAAGPYQGTMGCLRIALGRGVCGRAARTGEIQLVDDVAAFPDHIACDSRSRSELVIPVSVPGGVLPGPSSGTSQGRRGLPRVVAVLDLDSPHVGAFSLAEAGRLAELLGATLGAPSVRW